MALTAYNYTKNVNTSVLEDEVLADAGITTALDHVDTEDDNVDIWFVDAISGAEETALDAVVTAHSNPSNPTYELAFAGSGVPDDLIGHDGDVSFDAATLTLYRKVAGSWDAGTSIAEGNFSWQGAWVSQNYNLNDAVEYNGAAYHCILGTVSNEDPTNTTYWDLLAAKGDTGSQGSQGSVESDVQHAGSGADTNTTSATWVDLDSCALTTSNTSALDYIINFSCSGFVTTNNAIIEFRILADGVELAESLRRVTSAGANDNAVIHALGWANLANAKEIKIQFKTDAGTLTVHERCLTAHGVA